MASTFFGGFQEKSNTQAQNAFDLKMRSSLIDQQLQGQQQIEQEKFARENQAPIDVQNSLLDTMAKDRDVMGVKVPGLAGIDKIDRTKRLPYAALNQLQELYKDQANRALNTGMMKMPGPTKIETDEVGLPVQSVTTNLMGGEIRRQAMPDYSTKRQAYDRNTNYVQLLTQAHSIYSELAVHNALGAGSLFNRLPEDMANKRATLLAINRQLGPLEAINDEGVPGGRFTQALNGQLAATTQLPEHAKAVSDDLFYNQLLRAYGRYKNLGPDSVKIPQAVTDVFGGLPHDVNGDLIFKPSDLRVEDGKVYVAGRKDAIYDIQSGKPSIDITTINKLQNQGASQVASSPFAADPAAFQKALANVRAKH